MILFKASVGGSFFRGGVEGLVQSQVFGLFKLNYYKGGGLIYN